MLKTSVKQNKIRRFLYNKNYYFHMHKLIKLFLVKKHNKIRNQYWLDLYPQNFSFASTTKTRTICFLSGRSRSVYRLFRLSRLQIRAYSQAGYFIGLSKTSW